MPLQFPVEPDVKRRPVFLRIGTDHAIWHGTPYRLMNGRSVELLSPDGCLMIILTKPDWLGRQCHKPRNSFPSLARVRGLADRNLPNDRFRLGAMV